MAYGPNSAMAYPPAPWFMAKANGVLEVCSTTHFWNATGAALHAAVENGVFANEGRLTGRVERGGLEA